jgi:NTE family protein
LREYSPKRRTAVVFTGSGTTGAYHAGVLRALDESGVKLDLVVGSGMGAITAAFAAVAGGARL